MPIEQLHRSARRVHTGQRAQQISTTHACKYALDTAQCAYKQQRQRLFQKHCEHRHGQTCDRHQQAKQQQLAYPRVNERERAMQCSVDTLRSIDCPTRPMATLSVARD